jgi:hypothetical protein
MTIDKTHIYLGKHILIYAMNLNPSVYFYLNVNNDNSLKQSDKYPGQYILIFKRKVRTWTNIRNLNL